MGDASALAVDVDPGDALTGFEKASASPIISNVSTVREWIAIARDSIARCRALSIRRHWIPSRASSCAMINPVGPAPAISAFGFSLMAPSTSSQWRKCRLAAKVPGLALLREVLDPLFPP